jgi:signal transduction histidine kinase
MKVLMIDGQESDHSLIGDILTGRGCNLLEVTSGPEALRLAHKEAPDIAIADLLTPSFNRGEFVSRLRKDPVTARMPVIFYTDGYLEIASGTARDVDSLLTPMLLCEEAIRGRIIALKNGVVVPDDKIKNGKLFVEAVQDVFTFACPVGGERTNIKPADLIAEVVGEARKTFPKGVEITSAYSDELWLVEGDRRQLHRVLTTLFLNARDSMPKGGSLIVWARNFNIDQHYASMTLGARLGKYVMLRLSDTGGGTPRSVIDNIFSPYLESKEIGPGTSLGLIRSHGGFMSVYSVLGRGTTYQIFLPAKVLKPIAPAVLAQAEQAKSSYLLASA